MSKVKYDDRGNRVEYTAYNSDEELKLKFKSNDSGLITEYINYNATGRVKGLTNYEYNNFGYKVKQNNYESDEHRNLEMTQTFKWAYSQNRNLLREQL
jgi:hypothetical protein